MPRFGYQLIRNVKCLIYGTGISCKQIFQMCLSLTFHIYKIVFKVRISSPLQTYLVYGSNRKETRPQATTNPVLKKTCKTFPFKMSLCPHLLYIEKV